MHHFIQHTKQSRLLQAMALSCVVACSGNGEKTGGGGDSSDSGGSGGNNASSGGAATSGAASNTDAGGASASTMASGGTASETTTAASTMGAGGAGASDATSTADTTGAGGSAGEGTGGTGTTEPVGAVATLGDPCDSPGELACAGNYQKLTLVCGGDGEWEVNQTCGATEFCDSMAGTTQGICLEPNAECAGPLEERSCADGNVVSCEPDGLRLGVVEECDAGCVDGMCVLGEACPVGVDVVNCDAACGETHASCESGGISNIELEGPSLVFRTAPTQSLTAGCDEPMYGYGLILPRGLHFRAEAAPPWSVMDGSVTNYCGAPAAQCATSVSLFYVYTDASDAPATNVRLETVSEEEECP